MRGEVTEQPNIQVIQSRFIDAKAVNPDTGEVQFHIVSTLTTRIVIIMFTLALIIYAITLALIINNKVEIDQIKSVQVEDGQVQRDEQANEDRRNSVPTPLQNKEGDK
jgi:hypothetical protein